MIIQRCLWVWVTAWLLVGAGAQASSGSPAADVAQERARIGRAQALVRARFEQASIACHDRFAVSDCLRQERALRRDKLDDLRRQEVALNQLERARRAQDQLTRISGKIQSD